MGPVTKARLAEIGVLTIGQLAKTPGWSLEQLLGPAAGEKLAALAGNRDPREIMAHRRADRQERNRHSGGNLLKSVFFDQPYFADRIGARLRAKSRPGRTVTVRVRFANLTSATRSGMLDAPISATVILAEVAEELVRAVLADHPDEKTISLLAISVSHLEEHWDLELELPLGLQDEPPLRRKRRERLEALRTGDGRLLPEHLKAQIGRELDRLELTLQQIKSVETERDAMLSPSDEGTPAPGAMLKNLKGIGPEFAGVLWAEGLFRSFSNRRQLPLMPDWRPRPGGADPSRTNKASPKPETRGCEQP